MLRRRCSSRWPYSSQRSSSIAEVETLLSEPTPNAPPCARNAGNGKNPSPRLASVVGHSPATAPERASAAVSASVRWVA